MPFYLVIQTALVEADDAQAAAQKSVDQLRAGGRVKVEVKSDQATIAHHVVAAIGSNQPHAHPPAENSRPNPSVIEPIAPTSVSRKELMKRIATNAIALVIGRT
jgi:uncharacterized NAD(P)/FAD-binding protein YdhS